ncbi:SCO3242 family prenyltransferase [Streptosporangium lutulentum]|uniref:4-hydroxybenzoate polyprenyltransferase n=1 Tax=Streptosporangium lutulentum TaxID=1461250 RepID=A0ABT9Q642_9ACTN|nr:UbiA family prenyltransferase [Streptosporangium lutulentum]MDP9842207.1 4-hydroxybenzoate polyprenyltransferase [Streptosporangium lutulentum]
MAALRDFLDLVRAPAALSVPGDVVAGGAAAGSLGHRTPALACASVCIYWAGMAANDWADRRLDAVERPERPIPSGRISENLALATALGLTGAGLVAAGLAAGRRGLAVAAPLAAAVWTYDLLAKNTQAGPAVMAACRALDVLLGASPGLGAGRTGSRGAPPGPAGARSPSRTFADALPSALAVAAHTYMVTELSRREVSGADRRVPATTLAGTAALAAGVTVAGGSRGAEPGAALQAALASWYLARFGAAQARAVDEPSAPRIREAVGTGITVLPALQGALTVHAGAAPAGLAVALAAPLGRRLARKISPT